ncbi:MAG: pilus assembly protein CpaC [Bacteriovoracaceae bacterium]|jgi:pilus assembly protein CpaC
MKLILLTFFISFNLFAQERVKVRETNLNVAIGIDETIKLDYKYRTKVKLAREDLVQLILAPSKQEITFRGVKAGRVSVTIYDAAGEQRDKFIVNVTSDGNSNTVRELRELLGDIEGLKISIKGGKVIVDGEIVVPNQIGRVTTVMSKYPDVLLLIEYSKQTQLIVAREMQDAVNKNNMKDVTVRVVNGDYWLEGVVNSVPKKDLANDIANAYLPDTLSGLGQAAGGNRFQGRAKGAIANFINVNEKKDPEPPPKLIKVSSQFVELSKDYLKVFAFKWAPFMSNESSISFGKNEAGGISTDESGTLSGTISRLFPKLQSAKQAGYARVIQSGMAVTNNDKSIMIKKSSKLNFAVGSGDGQEAKEADISFQMTTVPKISNQENVELKDLNVSVSLPNGTSGSGTPQVTTNEVRTNLTVKSKESAVIGGIMQSNSATNYDKNDPDPVTPSSGDEDTGQASTLFNLLRSKSYTTGKSQFVVFVTPEILESASKGTEEIRRKFRKRER